MMIYFVFWIFTCFSFGNKTLTCHREVRLMLWCSSAKVFPGQFLFGRLIVNDYGDYWKSSQIHIQTRNPTGMEMPSPDPDLTCFNTPC